jgi:phage-related protein
MRQLATYAASVLDVFLQPQGELVGSWWVNCRASIFSVWQRIIGEALNVFISISSLCYKDKTMCPETIQKIYTQNSSKLSTVSFSLGLSISTVMRGIYVFRLSSSIFHLLSFVFR